MIYEIFISLIKLFLFPITLLIWLWFRQYKSLFDWLVMILLVGSVVAFLYYTGEWHWYGVYLRYVLLALYVAAVVRSFWRAKQTSFWMQKTSREWFGTAMILFFTLIFSLLSIWAYYGQSYHTEPIELSFPLKNGTYYAIEGGDSPLINKHHFYPDIPVKFSVDITKLNSVGTRAAGIYPGDLTDYAVFDEMVYSPCNGYVAEVIDSFPDLSPAYSDTATDENLGNRIKIKNKKLCVILAHLRQGRMQVQEGDTISAGQPVGVVGNSGNTPEPHLHIHAYLEGEFPPWEGKGIPLLLDGTFLARNSRMVAGLF